MQEFTAGVYMLCAALMPGDAPSFLAQMSVSDPRPTAMVVTVELCQQLLPVARSTPDVIRKMGGFDRFTSARRTALKAELVDALQPR